jgi:hypothetical protein
VSRLGAEVERVNSRLADQLINSSEELARFLPNLEGELRAEARELSSDLEHFNFGVVTAEDHIIDASVIHERAKTLGDHAARLVLRTREGLTAGTTRGRDALAGIERSADSIKQAVSSYVTDILRATDYTANIAKLAEEDSYTLMVDGYATAAGLGVTGVGSIKVSRNNDTYTLALEGSVGAAVLLELGGTIGNVGAYAQGQLSGAVGTQLEFVFRSAEEASRAVSLLLGRANTPSAENERLLEALKAHASAIELNGAALGNAFGQLGASPAATTFARGDAAAGVRFERTPSGGTELVVKKTVSGWGSVEAGGGPFDSYVSLATVKGWLELSVQRRYPMPQNVTFESVTRQPLETLKASTGALQTVEPAESVTVEFGADRGTTGQASGRVGTLEFRGRTGDVLSRDVMARVAKGDLRGALLAMPSSVEVEGEAKPLSKHGVYLNSFFSLMGFGGGLELTAQRTDVRRDETVAFEGTPSEVAQQLFPDLSV